jgi:hypothetical protein
MVSNTNLLNLYKFLLLPIHFNFANNISITLDVGSTNLHANGHSQWFQTISSSDLHSCLHLGDTFFCKGRKVMETSLKRSCLGALYMANSEANDITEMQIQSGDTIKIKPGCYVRTMDHIISADESETIEVKIKAIDWAGEFTDLFHHGNKDKIHQAVQGLRTRYNCEFDPTILLDQLDQLQNPDPLWAFTSPAAMIGAAICIFAVGICLWKICCRTREDPTPTPSAPPMLMLAIAPQLAAAPWTAPAPAQKPANNNRGARSNNPIPINITIT